MYCHVRLDEKRLDAYTAAGDRMLPTLRSGMVSLVVAAVLAFGQAPATTFVVHHNANLRAGASTGSAILTHLVPGDELTLVESTKTAGFYHVRTVAGVEGWIYQTLGHLEEPDIIPSELRVAAADNFEPSWPRPTPVGSILSGPPGTQPCPAAGEPGGDLETNVRKNRKDVPTIYEPVTFHALVSLPSPSSASTNRKTWTVTQRGVIAPFEGVAVSVQGYIVAVKKQSGGSGEATNCHFGTATSTDVHVALVEHAGDGEKTAVVVETTPRFYPQHPTWVASKLSDLDDSHDPVRISGWTLFDPVHKAHLGVYRTTLWEIHPVTRIEVMQDGQWRDW